MTPYEIVATEPLSFGAYRIDVEESSFFGWFPAKQHSFYVDEHIVIPRPGTPLPTPELEEQILTHLDKVNLQ